LYLVGINDAIKTSRELGITSLTDPDRYGLSLVIGGGEVSLLEMTSAYGSFATEGVRHPYKSVLEITDANGDIKEQYSNEQYEVLPRNTANLISSILSDEEARIPTFGRNSALNIPNVAVKTGTTNDNKDAWTVGYSTSVVVGAWVGNNDNTPMKKGGGALAGPIWNGIMKASLEKYPSQQFQNPDPINEELSPTLRGFWQGGETFTIDKISGKLATEFTPESTREEIAITNVHTILYWMDKKDPTGERPENPQKDSLFRNWEWGVQNWWVINRYKYKTITEANKPIGYDDVHTEKSKPEVEIKGIEEGYSYKKGETYSISISRKSINQIKKVDVFLNNTYITSLNSLPTTLPIKIPESIDGTQTLRVIIYDVLGSSNQQEIVFGVM
jgi:membrane peptidoglycan carboxypeptidase